MGNSLHVSRSNTDRYSNKIVPTFREKANKIYQEADADGCPKVLLDIMVVVIFCILWLPILIQDITKSRKQ